MTTSLSKLLAEQFEAIAEFQRASACMYSGPTHSMESLLAAITKADDVDTDRLREAADCAVGHKHSGVWKLGPVLWLERLAIQKTIDFAKRKLSDALRGLGVQFDEETQRRDEFLRQARACADAVDACLEVSNDSLREFIRMPISLLEVLSVLLKGLRTRTSERVLRLLVSVGSNLIEASHTQILQQCHDRDCQLRQYYEMLEQLCHRVCEPPDDNAHKQCPPPEEDPCPPAEKEPNPPPKEEPCPPAEKEPNPPPKEEPCPPAEKEPNPPPKEEPCPPAEKEPTPPREDDTCPAPEDSGEGDKGERCEPVNPRTDPATVNPRLPEDSGQPGREEPVKPGQDNPGVSGGQRNHPGLGTEYQKPQTGSRPGTDQCRSEEPQEDNPSKPGVGPGVQCPDEGLAGAEAEVGAGAEAQLGAETGVGAEADTGPAPAPGPVVGNPLDVSGINFSGILGQVGAGIAVAGVGVIIAGLVGFFREHPLDVEGLLGINQDIPEPPVDDSACAVNENAVFTPPEELSRVTEPMPPPEKLAHIGQVSAGAGLSASTAKISEPFAGAGEAQLASVQVAEPKSAPRVDNFAVVENDDSVLTKKAGQW